MRDESTLHQQAIRAWPKIHCRLALVRLSEQKVERFLEGDYTSRDTYSALHTIEREFPLLLTGGGQKVLRAIAACSLGAPQETVAKFLDWREFEMFCAGLMRARGFSVAENIVLTKPRIQVDLLARSHNLALLVDCKHWGRTMGRSALARAAAAQAERARVVRSKMKILEPIVVVIIVLSNEEARFVEGTAVVPIFALNRFLDDVNAFADHLVFF